MLAAWDFALPRDLRKMSTEEFAARALSLATRSRDPDQTPDAGNLIFG